MLEKLKANSFPVLLATAIILVSAGATPGEAQTRRDSVEIEPFGGWMFGGKLPNGSTSAFDESVDVDDHATWGLRVGYMATDVFGFEMAYLQDRTSVVSRGGLFEPNERLADLDLDMLEATMLFHMGHRRFRPFFAVGLGATRLDLGGDSDRSDTRFQGSLGGGFKVYFAPQVGFRFDVRQHWTVLDSNRDRDDENCRRCNDNNNDSLGTTEVSAGILFAF